MNGYRQRRCSLNLSPSSSSGRRPLSTISTVLSSTLHREINLLYVKNTLARLQVYSLTPPDASYLLDLQSSTRCSPPTRSFQPYSALTDIGRYRPYRSGIESIISSFCQRPSRALRPASPLCLCDGSSFDTNHIFCSKTVTHLQTVDCCTSHKSATKSILDGFAQTTLLRFIPRSSQIACRHSTCS